LVVDTCIQKHSRVFWYTNEFKDEKVKIIFDKKNVVTFKELNKSEFKKDLKSRISELKKTFLFFQVWPKKEIKRQHFLEAL
jgi:hypothetical protein